MILFSFFSFLVSSSFTLFSQTFFQFFQYILKKKEVHILARSDQSHADSVDLASTSPINVTVKTLVFVEGK